MNSLPHLLLLHGALGSEQQLTALRREMESSFNVHSLNFEGHGGSPSGRPFSMEGFVENVLAYLDANDLKSANIFGYSMGGYVALQLARSHPERVEKIVTYGTKLDWSPEASAKEVRMLNPDVIEEKVPKFAAHLKATHHPDHWRDVLAKTADMMLDLGQRPRLTNSTFAEVSCPVLVCIGSEDQMVTLAESQNAAEHLSQGTLLELNGYVHPIERVDSKALSKEVQAFLIGP
ncbi:alpha/beta hydrolase [Cryomorphaceae bacterium]|nr:alpha/beta hydrolase [Cryomorphaceae bacterium]